MYEQTSMIAPPQAEAKSAARYYEINEDTARSAHYCVHMSDYRPGSATNGYRAAVDEAAALVEARKSKVSPYCHDKLDALLDRYARRLAQWTNDYNRNQASYPSQFISGAGNYNMKKHEKQMSREGTLWKEYDEIKAILNKIEAVGTGAVDLADPHAREMLADQLQKLQSKLDESKALNAYYRKHKSFDGFPGLTAETAAKLTADFADTCQRCPWVKHPISDYELTSLRGKIKRVQARLDELGKRTEQAQQPAESTKFSGGEIVRNLEADRLQILFDEKPDEETRAALKQNGFRWSPRYSAWQRQLTPNAEAAARRAVFLRRFETREVFLIKEDRKHHAPHDADAHQKGDRGKSLRRHCRGRKAWQTDCLRRGLRDLRFIMQRADDRKAQPRPRRAETARERDDAEQDADARERGKRGARGDGALHFRFVHTDGDAGAVGAYHEEHAHQRNKENNAAADEIHGRTVELR